MNSNWDICFSRLIQHEGGYNNHPSDPGGRTNLGVTQEVWEDWIDRPVTEAEMRGLTPDKVKPLYKEMYWDRIKGDDLPSGLDYCVFDAAVNSGFSRASKWLQTVVSVPVDGSIGPKTLQAVNSAGKKQVIARYCDTRLTFLASLSTWPTFGRGWERRVNEVEATALSM